MSCLKASLIFVSYHQYHQPPSILESMELPTLTIVDFGMLHTHPKFQKRGAASALIQWGVKKGEELNLPVYLEASGVGHPLYHKHGFEYIDVHSVDLTPYGGEGIIHRAPIMMKDAPRKGKGNAKL